MQLELILELDGSSRRIIENENSGTGQFLGGTAGCWISFSHAIIGREI
jgi:hypothetical protein